MVRWEIISRGLRRPARRPAYGERRVANRGRAAAAGSGSYRPVRGSGRRVDEQHVYPCVQRQMRDTVRIVDQRGNDGPTLRRSLGKYTTADEQNLADILDRRAQELQQEAAVKKQAILTRQTYRNTATLAAKPPEHAGNEQEKSEKNGRKRPKTGQLSSRRVAILADVVQNSYHSLVRARNLFRNAIGS